MTDPAADTEIRRTIAEYCQTVDDGRFDDFAKCFALDAVFRVMGEEIEGRAAIQDWITKAQPAERRGRHVTVNSVIRVDGDQADASSDFLFLAKGDEGPRVSIAGRYLDTFAPADDRWVFTSREIVFWPQD